MITKTKKNCFLTAFLAGTLLSTTIAGIALSACTNQDTPSDTPSNKPEQNFYNTSINWNDKDAIDKLVTDDETGLVYADKAKTQLIAIKPESKVSELVIPATVKFIVGYKDTTPTNKTTQDTDHSVLKGAFEGMTNLNKVTFESNDVTLIGDQAFKGCTNLATVELPTGLESIGNQAFENCNNLRNINLEVTQVTSIGQAAFANTTALKTFKFPASLKTINAGDANILGAFEGSGISEVDLSGTQLTSDDGVSGWRNADLGATGHGTFSQTKNLKTVKLPSKLTGIPDSAFYNSGVTTLSFGSSNTIEGTLDFTNITSSSFSIGQGAFNGNGTLSIGEPTGNTVPVGAATIKLATKTTTFTINDKAFYDMNKLATVNLVGSTSATAISPLLFVQHDSKKPITVKYEDNSSLRVDINESDYTSIIGDNASFTNTIFANMTGVSSLTLNNNTNKATNFIGPIFNKNANLTTLTLDAGGANLNENQNLWNFVLSTKPSNELTDVDYATAPIGNNSILANINYEGLRKANGNKIITPSTPTTEGNWNALGGANGQSDTLTWGQIAHIMNMFAKVTSEESNAKNLTLWESGETIIAGVGGSSGVSLKLSKDLTTPNTSIPQANTQWKPNSDSGFSYTYSSEGDKQVVWGNWIASYKEPNTTNSPTWATVTNATKRHNNVTWKWSNTPDGGISITGTGITHYRASYTDPVTQDKKDYLTKIGTTVKTNGTMGVTVKITVVPKA